jgi:hypothetical protein
MANAPEQHPHQAAAKPAPVSDKAAADKAAAEQKEAMAASSIGAQVILDYNSQAGLGARGGAAGTVEENTRLRDENLAALGLDPASPSGPPTGEPYEPPAVMAAQPKHVSGQATKHSSLAAGIQSVPTPPPAR